MFGFLLSSCYIHVNKWPIIHFIIFFHISLITFIHLLNTLILYKHTLLFIFPLIQCHKLCMYMNVCTVYVRGGWLCILVGGCMCYLKKKNNKNDFNLNPAAGVVSGLVSFSDRKRESRVARQRDKEMLHDCFYDRVLKAAGKSTGTSCSSGRVCVMRYVCSLSLARVFTHSLPRSPAHTDT